jgi:hypothetical protein
MLKRGIEALVGAVPLVALLAVLPRDCPVIALETALPRGKSAHIGSTTKRHWLPRTPLPATSVGEICGC